MPRPSTPHREPTVDLHQKTFFFLFFLSTFKIKDKKNSRTTRELNFPQVHRKSFHSSSTERKGQTTKKKCPGCRRGHFTATLTIQEAQEVDGARLRFSKLTGLAGPKETHNQERHAAFSWALAFGKWLWQTWHAGNRPSPNWAQFPFFFFFLFVFQPDIDVSLRVWRKASTANRKKRSTLLFDKIFMSFPPGLNN